MKTYAENLKTQEPSSRKQGLIQKALANYRNIKTEIEHRETFDRVMSDPLWWLRHATKTMDPHWQKKGLDGPFQPFPDKPYLEWVFAFLRADNAWLKGHGLPEDPPRKKRRAFTKSRSVLLSWSVIGFVTHLCQCSPGQQVLLQSLNQEKANGLLEYAKTLWFNQEPWLKARFPLARRYEDLSESKIEWANASEIIAIPQGADAIRSFHPTLVIMDEAGFQPEGQEAIDIALPAVADAILLSSANPGWYSEFVDGDDYDERRAS